MAGAIKKNRHRETWSTFLCLLLPCLSETVLLLEYRSDELLKLKILFFFYNYAVFFFSLSTRVARALSTRQMKTIIIMFHTPHITIISLETMLFIRLLSLLLTIRWQY